jgi:hypothetical protein
MENTDWVDGFQRNLRARCGAAANTRLAMTVDSGQAHSATRVCAHSEAKPILFGAPLGRRRRKVTVGCGEILCVAPSAQFPFIEQSAVLAGCIPVEQVAKRH